MAVDPRMPGRSRSSLRFSVTLLATVAVAAVLVITGTVLLVAQRRQLTENVDDAVRQRADDLTALVTAGQLPDVLANWGPEATLAQVVASDGTVLAASANIAGEPPIAQPPPSGLSETLRTVGPLPIDDELFRLLSRRLASPMGPVVLHVAGSLDEVSDSTQALGASLFVTIPALLAALAALVWWLVGRTLRPIEAIRAEVAEIGATDLDRRVPQPSGDDEIARLARTMNAMLDRVEDATRRQQRFVADASHELRSPLTRIRTELEVDLAHPGGKDLASTHRSLLEETVRLQRLVDDLLYLARTDAGVATGKQEPVDLDDLLLRDARRIRSDGRVRVDLSGVSAAQVRGDPDQLARAVRNLTDNAMRHARSTVFLTLAEQDQGAVLIIADDGPGIPADQRERIFDRFARLDDARTTEAGGTGLGLAIARDIIGRHGGTIAIDADYQNGTRFTITIPTDRGDR